MRIRPSKLGHLALCPKFDMVDSEEVTSIGTRLHNACASRKVDGLGPEDKAAVEAALEFAEQYKASLAPPVQDFVEHSVYSRRLGLGGTVDRLLVGADGRIVVIDWKMGPAGLPDDADESWQVTCYLLGAFDEFPNSRSGIGVLTNPRTRTTSAEIKLDSSNIEAEVSRLQSVIDRAEDPFSEPIQGSHCAKCKHAARCWALVPTIRSVATPLAPDVLDLFRDPSSVNLTPVMRSARACIRMIVDRWSEAVKDDDNEFVKGNDPPPGFVKRVRSTGLRVPEAERFAALQALRTAGVDESVIAAGCNIALGKMIEAQTLVSGDKVAATELIQGAVEGIAVEGTTEFMARDKKEVPDKVLFPALRERLALPESVK